MVFAPSEASPAPAPGLDAIPEHLVPREEWYEVYLRWALYAGAAFQLACILAVLLLPPNKGARGRAVDEDGSTSEEDDDEVSPGRHQPLSQPAASSSGGGVRSSHGGSHGAARRKADKKKKRL